MTEYEILSVLFALLDLSADGRAAAGSVAQRVGLSHARVAEVLLHLERRGLADASRVRLTLHGLAVAQGLAAQARRARQQTAA